MKIHGAGSLKEKLEEQQFSPTHKTTDLKKGATSSLPAVLGTMGC